MSTGQGQQESQQRRTELQIEQGWRAIAEVLKAPSEQRSPSALEEAVTCFPFQEARALARENRTLRGAYEKIVESARDAAKKGGGSPMAVSIAEMVEDEDGNTDILLISCLGDHKVDDGEVVKRLVSLIASKIMTEQHMLNMAYDEVMKTLADIIESLLGPSPHASFAELISSLREGSLAKIMATTVMGGHGEDQVREEAEGAGAGERTPEGGADATHEDQGGDRQRSLG